jgi:hypothetical protein
MVHTVSFLYHLWICTSLDHPLYYHVTFRKLLETVQDVWSVENLKWMNTVVGLPLRVYTVRMYINCSCHNFIMLNPKVGLTLSCSYFLKSYDFLFLGLTFCPVNLAHSWIYRQVWDSFLDTTYWNHGTIKMKIYVCFRILNSGVYV